MDNFIKPWQKGRDWYEGVPEEKHKFVPFNGALGGLHLFKLWAVRWWITWVISSWEKKIYFQSWENSQNDNFWPFLSENICHFVNLLCFWAEEQQTSWVIAPWWLSVSTWQICITLFWPSSSLKLTAPSSWSERHLHFASLDTWSVSC